jgi:hypothetical protein
VPKFIRDNMEIDDIEGSRSRRLYRGSPRNLFRTDDIEGAHSRKLKRGPRSFAFDDYKDVTSELSYRRPFVNSPQRIENQYIAHGKFGGTEHNHYNPQISSPNQYPPTNVHHYSNITKNNNYDVPDDQYSEMNYYDLPVINKITKINAEAHDQYNVMNGSNTYNRSANTFNKD